MTEAKTPAEPASNAAEAARMNVGHLRAALAKYPDDMPLQVAVPDERYPDVVDEGFIVTSVGVGYALWNDRRGRVDNDYLTIELHPLPDEG